MIWLDITNVGNSNIRKSDILDRYIANISEKIYYKIESHGKSTQFYCSYEIKVLAAALFPREPTVSSHGYVS